MKGIVGYHLINVAAFRYSECNVNGHCQYIGHNGNGKTTNLRVPLYFYNPSGDRRDHAIESSKHGFNDFYFNGERSFIVYEVCREILTDGRQDLYHIAINRRAGAPKFIFIDAPYEKSLFRNENGHVCNERELLGNLEVAGIKSESVGGYEAYRSIVYGIDYHERFKRFVYAFPKPNAEKHLRTIPKILSAIFRAENTKTETLKDALIASLGEEEAMIDLRQTGKEMKQFNRDRTELMLLESQLERIKCICSDFAEYKDRRADLNNLTTRIHLSFPRAEHCLNMESTAIRVLEDEQRRATASHKSSLLESQEKLQVCTRNEGSITEQLDEIKKIQTEYSNATLKIWEQSERELANLRQSYEEREAKLKGLTDEYESIQDKYKTLLEKVKASFEKLRQSVTEIYQSALAQGNDQIGEIQNERSSAIAELQDSFESGNKEVNVKVTDLRVEATKIEERKSNLRLDDFRGDAIRERRELLGKLESDNAINEAKCKGLLERHKAIESRKGSGLLKIGQKYDSDIREFEEQAKGRRSEIEKLLPIIERYAGSLLETVDREDIQPDVFRAIVNEQILLLRSDSLLRPDEESPKSALLGLHIDTEALPVPADLSLEEAQKRHVQIQDELDKLAQKIYALRAARTSAIEDLENTYQQELREHQEYADNVRSEGRRLLHQLNGCKEELDADLEAQRVEFEERVKDLESRRQSTNQSLLVAQQAVENFNESCRSQLSKLKLSFDHRIKEKRSELEIAKSRCDSEMASLKTRLDESRSKLEQDKTAELKAGSHKPEEIEQVTKDKNDAEELLSTASDNVRKLTSYREHRLPTVQKLPELLEQQKENSSQMTKIKTDQKELEDAWENQRLEIGGRIRTHRERFDLSKEDIEAFEQWDSDRIDEHINASDVSVYSYTPGDIKRQLTECQQIANRMRSLWDGKTDTRANQIYDFGIYKNVEHLIGRFEKSNRFSFPSVFESDQEIRDFIDYKLSVMLATDSLGKERKQVLEAFRLTMRNLSREYESLEDSKTRLMRTLTAIQNSISNDGIFVASINSIEFDLQPAKTRTGRLRDALKSCIDKLDPSNLNLDSVQDDFFAHKPSLSEIGSLMDQVHQISNDINDHNIESIKLGDLVDFVIRITENGVSHGWKPLVEGVGSEGTGALAKFIIYTGILSHFKKSVYKNANELHLHCMIDEIGKIYAGYVTELLNYCRKLGIYLVTAQPNTHSKPGDFERTFMIDRNEQTQRARVTPVLEARVIIG